MNARSAQEIAEEDYVTAVQQKVEDLTRAPIKSNLALQLEWAPIIRDGECMKQAGMHKCTCTATCTHTHMLEAFVPTTWDLSVHCTRESFMQLR